MFINQDQLSEAIEELVDFRDNPESIAKELFPHLPEIEDYDNFLATLCEAYEKYPDWITQGIMACTPLHSGEWIKFQVRKEEK